LIKRIVLSVSVALLGATGVLQPVLAARPAATVNLVGAGSTFDLPFFTKAFDVYCKQKRICVNYQAIGSGAGVQQITAKTVDFGASDVPMNPATELPAARKAGGPVLQVPIALGGVAIAYNIPGVKRGLHLTGPVIADMYMGITKYWDAKPIKKLNPKVKLPHLRVTPVYRSDSSGTSYIFTSYLAKVSDPWQGQVGVGKLPQWPAGVGGKGNPGVAATVQNTPGAVGYVELAYVLQNHMKDAMLQNRSGTWVFPTTKSVAAAASKFPHVSATQFSIVDAKGAASYPICGYSWVLMFKKQTDASKGKALKALMQWLATKGQTYAATLDYVALPKKVQLLAQKELKTVST